MLWCTLLHLTAWLGPACSPSGKVAEARPASGSLFWSVEQKWTCAVGFAPFFGWVHPSLVCFFQGLHHEQRNTKCPSQEVDAVVGELFWKGTLGAGHSKTSSTTVSSKPVRFLGFLDLFSGGGGSIQPIKS